MPYLEGVMNEDEAKAVRDQIDSQVKESLRPYRIRFYFVLGGFLIFAALGLYGYQANQDQQQEATCQAVRQNRDVLKRIISIATDPQPNATPQQAAAARAFRERTEKIIDSGVCQ